MFKRKVKGFKAPVLYVPGNHDVGAVGDGSTKTTINSRRVALFNEVLGANWFAREAAGVRVVGLNSCLFGSGLKEESEQWQFLERELAQPHPEPTFLLEHYPIFVKSVEEPGRSNHNVQPGLRQKLLALVKQSGARAVLSGHLHYPITNRLDHVLFLGNTTTAFGLPRGKQPEGWMLLSVPTQGEITFDFRRLK